LHRNRHLDDGRLLRLRRLTERDDAARDAEADERGALALALLNAAPPAIGAPIIAAGAPATAGGSANGSALTIDGRSGSPAAAAPIAAGGGVGAGRGFGSDPSTSSRSMSSSSSRFSAVARRPVNGTTLLRAASGAGRAGGSRGGGGSGRAGGRGPPAGGGG